MDRIIAGKGGLEMTDQLVRIGVALNKMFMFYIKFSVDRNIC
jgi:hypothetical protein